MLPQITLGERGQPDGKFTSKLSLSLSARSSELPVWIHISPIPTTSSGSGTTLTGSAFTYDAMGRVLALWQCAPSTCGTSTQTSRPLFFGSDWTGNLIQEDDGGSGSINYGRSVAGEVTSVTNATYTNAPYNPPNLVSNVVNGPDGPVTYTLGNGLNVFRGYDPLGRLGEIWVCSGAAPASANCSGGSTVYAVVSGQKGSQVQTELDTVLSQQFSYGYTDGLNRLTARTNTSGAPDSYTYGNGGRNGGRRNGGRNGGQPGLRKINLNDQPWVI